VQAGGDITKTMYGMTDGYSCGGVSHRQYAGLTDISYLTVAFHSRAHLSESCSDRKDGRMWPELCLHTTQSMCLPRPVSGCTRWLLSCQGNVDNRADDSFDDVR